MQLAAFSNEIEATHMKATLGAKGWTIFIEPVVQNHRQWYRVMLGPFTSRHDAENAQQKIARRERIPGMIREVLL